MPEDQKAAYDDVQIPLWQWKWIKRWHNLRCNQCRPVYTFWAVRPR